MPITLPPTFREEIHRPHGDQQTIVLIELEVAPPTDGPSPLPATIFRCSNYHQQVTWPLGILPAQVWYPFNFTLKPAEQNQEGDLPQMELAIDNSTRALMRFLHNGDGLEGNNCLIYYVMESGIDIAWPDHEYRLVRARIAGASATHEAITFRLEQRNFFEVRVPQDRYSVHVCKHEYGGPRCGYVRNEVAAFQTCPGTLDACIARGQDHAARGLPVLHPKRWGAFPGIQRIRG